jgi:serine/threonine protein kinase
VLLDDKYQIEEQLGQGGMGSVYRAIHLGTKRTVALKVIRPQFTGDEEFILRFRREAEAAGRLRHPNVVDVTDFGFAATAGGRVAYLVMEYLDGRTLADILAEAPRLPIDWVLDILDQTCSAVDQAHRQGIIHRDLKPENIWLEPNRRGGYTVKVLDFGLAKLAHSDSAAESVLRGGAAAADRPRPAATAADPSESQTLLETVADGDHATQLYRDGLTGAAAALESARVPDLTRVGSVMGTPLYMSPEQCRGEPLDARSDIYSLGVIAYRMLAGETPFAGDMESLIRLHGEAEPIPIGRKNRKVSKRAGQLIMSALAKDPALRPQSAAGFATAFRARAERTGTVFRQAFSLYSERFPSFLKLSLAAYIPLAAMLLIPFHLERVGGGQPGMEVIAAMAIGFTGAHLFAYAVISAVTVLVVIQLAVAPLRPISLRTAFGSLKNCWLQLLLTLLAWGALRFVALALPGFGAIALAVHFASYTAAVPHSVYAPAGLLLLVPAVAVAATFSLCGPVVAVERPGVIRALKRAAVLMLRSKTTVVIIAILHLAVPALLYALFNKPSINFDIQPDQSSFGFQLPFDSRFTQLLNVLTTPLLAIMAALVYLKTRRAGGETLDDAADQIAGDRFPGDRLNAIRHSRTESH